MDVSGSNEELPVCVTGCVEVHEDGSRDSGDMKFDSGSVAKAGVGHVRRRVRATLVLSAAVLWVVNATSIAANVVPALVTQARSDCHGWGGERDGNGHLGIDCNGFVHLHAHTVTDRNSTCH